VIYRAGHSGDTHDTPHPKHALCDNIIPITPPIVNKNTNPIAHNIRVSHFLVPLNIVTIQLNIFIPIGTTIIIVSTVKYAHPSLQ